MKILKDLQNVLNYHFTEVELLQLAITHSSWAHERQLPETHNERLEFLGDAVLELCVSRELYLRFPQMREGMLTAMRARLVGETSLVEIALAIGLDKFLRLGIGEERQGGRQRNSILSDALEAVLGAVFLDGGYEAAQKVVSLLFANCWPDENFTQPELDNKSRLQEYCQRNFRKLPEYVQLGATGPDHERLFEVALLLPDGRKYLARGTSWKKAEQACAALALESLGEAPKAPASAYQQGQA